MGSAHSFSPDRERAQAFLERFKGVRHAPRRACEKRGVDCIQLVIGTIQAGGFIGEFRWPQYRQDVGFHLRKNSLEEVLKSVFFCKNKPEDSPVQDFDIGLFKVGRMSNHCGIMMGGRFWHVTNDHPVHSTSHAAIERNLESWIRLEKKGFRTQPANLQK